jgi:hypothetical protein
MWRRASRRKGHLILVGAGILTLAGGASVQAQGSGEPSFTFSGPIVFGFVPVGSTSAPMSVVVSNTGGGKLDITGVAAEDTDPHPNDPHDFSISSDGCTGASLGTGQSCTVAVVFHPVKEGTRVGALAFTDNRTPCGNYVTLAGSALSAPATATVADCVPAATTNPSPAVTPRSGVKSERVAHLGSTAKCTSRRVIQVHLNTISGDRVTIAKVYIDQKLANVVHGSNVRVVAVDLRGCPKARYEVQLVLHTTKGHTLETRRAFLTCIPSKV